jgi:hypothetical protein
MDGILKSWIDEDTGYVCIARKHTSLGFLMGYVGVIADNPLYEANYSNAIVEDISVHGGLTFSGAIDDGDLWLLGFDCGHAGDLVPHYPGAFQREGDVYRDLEYVEAQCTSLAKQMYEIAKKYEHELNI